MNVYVSARYRCRRTLAIAVVCSVDEQLLRYQYIGCNDSRLKTITKAQFEQQFEQIGQPEPIRTVFVSGGFDVLHGGHVEFFERARELGERLVVCVPTDEAFLKHKCRQPCLTAEHKVRLIESLKMVDEVVLGGNLNTPGLNFESELRRVQPAYLVTTEDDKYLDAKKALCREVGVEYARIPKRRGDDYDLSASDFVARMSAPSDVPLRVDFAGGWLDVPDLAIAGGFIVNCTINLLVNLNNCYSYKSAGLGGSAAYAALTGKDAVKAELGAGVGWQDPAVINETGLCVWRSGARPVLDAKLNPDWLAAKMALYWTGKCHNTKSIKSNKRDYKLIFRAADIARRAVLAKNFPLLCAAIRDTYSSQLIEGMDPLPDKGEMAKKYVGSGFGGCALYVFDCFADGADGLQCIEPYMEERAKHDTH